MGRIRKSALVAFGVLIFSGTIFYAANFVFFDVTDCTIESKAQSELLFLDTNLVRFRVQNERFPTQEEGLESLVNVFINARVLIDPWGNQYQYIASYDDGDPMVWSFGEDGKGGTSDDLHSRELLR